MFSKLVATFLALFCVPALASAQRFFPDDPLTVDLDRVIDVGEPRQISLSDYYEFLQHSFTSPGDRAPRRAISANTLGEVPDSSWFQNRHGKNRMTLEQLARGPNQGPGPATESPWRVIAGKTEGITPGFRIRDARGDVYLIKFDPITNPEMATAAEIISTKFFFAAGYNVPENYLVFFERSDVVVDSAARVSVGLGPPRPMTEADLDAILARVHKQPDGKYRAVASKFLSGRPIGPFKYYGTRSDDANDVIPHEHRRELRGLRVLSAWLNHDDSRAINTLDAVERADGINYVRHYLIDFGSTLGSGSVWAQKPRAGWEYIWEPAPTLRRAITLGLWDSPWVYVDYPEIPSVGRFESKAFDPASWKPEYPNPAFLNSLPEDSYWGAKLIMAFTDEDIRAIVRTGRLSDTRAEEYLIRCLIERRDKVGRLYFNEVLSLDRWTLQGAVLRFAHLASQYGFAPAPPQYRVAWFRFDNDRSEKTFVGEPGVVTQSALSIPQDLAAALYFGVDVENGSKKITVFLHREPSLRIIGIERESSGQ
jgi:hypothetical protein